MVVHCGVLKGRPLFNSGRLPADGDDDKSKTNLLCVILAKLSRKIRNTLGIIAEVFSLKAFARKRARKQSISPL